MGKTKISDTNYAVPAKPMTEDEIVEMIKAAENSKFHSTEHLNKKISEWKLKFGK